MSYSDFTLDQVQQAFELVIIENQDLFSQMPEAEISTTLVDFSQN